MNISLNSNSMSLLKPKMSAHDLIIKMQDDKGILFNNISEAENYLLESNNFLRLFCYRKNYEKHQKGKNINKYISI